MLGAGDEADDADARSREDLTDPGAGVRGVAGGHCEGAGCSLTGGGDSGISPSGCPSHQSEVRVKNMNEQAYLRPEHPGTSGTQGSVSSQPHGRA